MNQRNSAANSHEIMENVWILEHVYRTAVWNNIKWVIFWLLIWFVFVINMTNYYFLNGKSYCDF